MNKRKNQLQASGRAAVATRLRARKRKAARTAEENSALNASGTWVRYESKTHTGYRVLVSPRQLQAFGVPRDPWGEKMRPANGVAPRKIADPVALRRLEQSAAMAH
jgi:hypothetical protein